MNTIPASAVLFVLNEERVVYYLPTTIHFITSVVHFKHIHECRYQTLIEYCTKTVTKDNLEPLNITLNGVKYTVSSRTMEDTNHRVIQCLPSPPIQPLPPSTDSLNDVDTKHVGVNANYYLKCLCKKIIPPMHAMFNVVNVLSYMDYNTTSGNDDMRSLLRTLHELFTDVIRIITNVTIYLKIQDGKFHLDTSTFNIHECVEETKQFIKKIDTTNTRVGITFHLENLHKKQMYHGDRFRIQQVLHHLLTNSFNHTETGKIVVNTNTRSVDDEVDEIILTVSDNGTGIPADRLGNIYEPFHTHENGGGLGLFISKHIVTLMDGTIHIDSNDGEGTSVCLKIPLNKMGVGTTDK